MFRLTNSDPGQNILLRSPAAVLVIRQIKICSLWHFSDPADWIQEMREMDFCLTIRYDDKQKRKTEYSLHFLPWVTPRHIRPLFYTELFIPSPLDWPISSTIASVEVTCENTETPFDIEIYYDALADTELVDK